jgi:TP901 family phage tail tape measure protein
MTEIAVVSDYTIDQIWAMRQTYSDAATKMGAKTIDLVNATKLYVQQGLTLNEALEVGIETTKMARIANLDGAEATNLMTAALRGFNMEMQEANRVNDTYSQLAAKSAADTQEIATAMSKTASIAANAGSSFENMSAFLTQIIETTREAPETAGTAMKTIIARFQELKKPMSEIGEVDGEIVDANGIETALKTAGIALRDTSGEFRDFDDVIIELASKWNSLDVMTQRYIATMAAGSRQQSRFIALMSDSERLTELVGYANNSAGAANEQYEKTLESLTAKLNELSNAWNLFLTNFANNKIIKGFVDLLTAVVTAINKIIEPMAKSENIMLNILGMVLQLGMGVAAFMV